MRKLFLLIVASLLAACEPKGPYPWTAEEILSRQRAAPGEIFLVEGSRFGTFKEGPSGVGNVNTSGSFRTRTKLGTQPPVEWPATPGFSYEVNSYINELDECLYVVRKIKAP